MDLNQLDFEKRGPMVVRVAGVPVTLPSAADLPWRIVMAAAGDVDYFGSLVWPADVRVSYKKLKIAQHAWVTHNGLPELTQIQRLVYMMERYYDGIEYDLRAKLGVSAGDLWRERRWRELLGFIDQLPANTHKNRLLTQDEEYMEAVLRNRKGDGGPGRPSMAEWSEEARLIAVLIDAVNRNTAVQQALASSKGPKPTVTPVPRPATVAEEIEKKLTKESHESFVSMLLPSKREDEVS